MRNLGAVIMCIFVLSIVNPGYVVSEVHGLSMGFSEGAEFHYTILVGQPKLDDYYAVVNEVGTFPENFSNPSPFTVNITGYWSNGTEISETDYAYGLLVPGILWVPIGNWTYVRYLLGYEPEQNDPYIVDTEELWGVDATVGEETFTHTFWKSDGALYELHSSTSGTEIHIMRSDVSTSTTSTPGTTTTAPTTNTETTNGTSGSSIFDMPETLLILIGGVGVILIFVVIILKKR